MPVIFCRSLKNVKTFFFMIEKVIALLLDDVLCCNVFFRVYRRMSLYVYFGFHFELWRVVEGVNP